MTEILIIAALTVLLMASLAVNGYLLGARSVMRPVEVKPDEIKLEQPAVTNQVPRPPRINTETGKEQRYQTGMKFVSPREAINREMQKREGLITETPQVPAAIKSDFLKEAGAVVASPAN